MALSVKAYLSEDSGHQQEIRRFAIDEGASANYGYLVQKIESVFPRIKGKKISLFWKDSDDEMITFSSDEELVEALGSFGGDVFRVHVKVEQVESDAAAQAQEGHDSAQVHPHVTCDSCEESVAGIRFKCTVCPNFDLCASCEIKGLHNQHEMLRIAIPRSNPWVGFQFPVPPHHPCPPDVPFTHPPHPFGDPRGPWGFPGGRGRGHHARGHRGGFGPFRGRGGCGGPRGRCGRGAKCHRHGNRNAADVPVGPPFLHHLGENIASFLAPFGVEVHTYADNEPVCCQGQCPPTAEPNPGPTDKTSAQTEHAATATATAAASASATVGQPPACDDCSCSGDKMEEAPEEFEFVDEDSRPSAASQGGAEGTSTSDAVDPLEVAIAQMRSMGFEDDSGTGWLSQLIKSKNYDIGKVLDAVQYDGKH